MNFQTYGPYKSLPPFQWNDIPSFSVLTGKNGSGKSQLLQALEMGLKRKWHTNTLPPNISPASHVKNPTIENTNYSYDDTVLISNNWDLIEGSPIGLSNLQIHNSDLFATFQRWLNLRKQGQTTNPNTVIGQLIFENFFTEHQDELTKNIEITEDVFKDLFNKKYIERLETQVSNSLIGLRFYSYYIKLAEHKLKDGIDANFFTENGPKPWETINSIFGSIGLDFEISSPEGIGLSSHFTLQLRRQGTKIKFDDLSSGERVLVSLVFWLFNSEDISYFPKVLLLDEPDAHLHPEITQKLLYVLKEVLVEKFDVRVILTTHSPTTVALAPDESIFEVDNTREDIVRQISKEEALEILTGSIPTLSIDYKNHKQVFCESPTDVYYYQSIYNKIYNSTCPKLYFISNGYGEGNCQNVYNIVDQIRTSGNTTSFGIVDWDLENKETTYVKVHGSNERYSIENYILDPFYVIALLLEMRNKEIITLLSLPEQYNQYNIGGEAEERLQEISDKFFNFLTDKYPAYKSKTDMQTVEYQNRKRIQMPKWYLLEKGHSIEEKIKKVFPALGGKYQTTSINFQRDIIEVIGKCYPFVPKTTVEFLQQIS